MKKQLLLAACAVIIGTVPASQADAVLDWNAIAAQTIRKLNLGCDPFS